MPQTHTPSGRTKALLALVSALATLAGTGCFRATGLQRNPMTSEVLPVSGGDSVPGLKSKSGAGDYYLGNDFIQIAIDSAVYGDTTQTPLAGALSGGSIVDAGYIGLDNSYNRVAMPGTMMNRLTPVVNQNPKLPVVFTSYQTQNNGSLSTIIMTGKVLDQTGALGGTPGAVVPGVTVTETISVAQLQHFFTLSTTVTNNGASPVNIVSVGDCLVQQGSGYRLAIPAAYDYDGNALASWSQAYAGAANLPGTMEWGVEIPGSDMTGDPLHSSVRAPLVGLMDTEPAADTMDSHASVGFLPLDADQMLVASSPQDLLSVADNLRPNQNVPQYLAVGSLPAAGNLAAGSSLTFNRRMYIIGGRSVDTNQVGGQQLAAGFPDQCNGLFNVMDWDRYADTTIPNRPVAQNLGILTFSLGGSSQRQGPLPTEIRVERDLSATLPGANPSANDTYRLQRVEWLEPNENLSSVSGGFAPSTLSMWLPLGNYRITLTTQSGKQLRTSFEDTNSEFTANQSGPIWIQQNQTFNVSSADVLCPDGLSDPANPNQVTPITVNPYVAHYFTTRETNGALYGVQPLRLTFLGATAAQNPVMRRARTLGSYFNQYNQQPAVAPGLIPGQDQYRGGNEMFGGGFTRQLASTYAWLPNNSTFTVYASRGPLEEDQTLTLTTADGQNDVNHIFTFTNLGLPAGWNSFDLPGPSQATTGGYLPDEKFASALANGVQVVADTEQDLQVNPAYRYFDWIMQFALSSLSTFQRPASLSYVDRPVGVPCGGEPFIVGARSSSLTGYGTATALFTPAASSAPLGGAQPSAGWTLADFISQAQGQYNIVNRPLGPDGLFTQVGAPDPGQFPTSWNTSLPAWWKGWSAQSGTLSFGGATNGSFDALELLSGVSLAGSTPTDWFNEFLRVRSDWFALLNTQSPAFFTKGLGLSSAMNSIDTPVGLARTYLKAVPLQEEDLSSVLTALKSGAAVASTGPLLDVSIGSAGPGQLVPGPVQNVILNVNLYTPSWVPVDELRVVVNGVVAETFAHPIAGSGSVLQATGADPRMYGGSITLPISALAGAGKDAWVVVEAGVPLSTTGAYAPNPAWNAIMRGIYPVAVTNPIFVSVTGNSTFQSPQ